MQTTYPMGTNTSESVNTQVATPYQSVRHGLADCPHCGTTSAYSGYYQGEAGTMNNTNPMFHGAPVYSYGNRGAGINGMGQGNAQSGHAGGQNPSVGYVNCANCGTQAVHSAYPHKLFNPAEGNYPRWGMSAAAPGTFMPGTTSGTQWSNTQWSNNRQGQNHGASGCANCGTQSVGTGNYNMSSTAAGGNSYFTGTGDVTSPIISCCENESTLQVIAEMPGAAENSIDVTIMGPHLIISGARRSETSLENSSMLYSEGQRGYYRTLQLPMTYLEVIDISNTAVEFKNGCLYINIPKTAAGKSRYKKIEIGKKTRHTATVA